MKRLMGKGLIAACLACLAGAFLFTIAGASEVVSDGKDASPPVSSGGAPVYIEDYILGPGDVLEITTWKDDSLSKVVPILPDGNIHFPLIGAVTAAGKTVTELQREIEERISKYVPDPYVGVSVQQVNSMTVYIIGKVNHPGRFLLNSNVNVLQALAMAGGLNTFANGDKIKIIREDDWGQHILGFDYDRAAKGKNLDENIPLKRGDIIVVP